MNFEKLFKNRKLSKKFWDCGAIFIYLKKIIKSKFHFIFYFIRFENNFFYQSKMSQKVEDLKSIKINEKHLDDYVNSARDACLINGIKYFFISL